MRIEAYVIRRERIRLQRDICVIFRQRWRRTAEVSFAMPHVHVGLVHLNFYLAVIPIPLLIVGIVSDGVGVLLIVDGLHDGIADVVLIDVIAATGGIGNFFH